MTGLNGAGAAQIAVGIGVDGATLSDDCVSSFDAVSSGEYRSFPASYEGAPGLGYRTIVPLEYGAGSGTQTWGGLGTTNDGIVGRVAA